MNCPFCGETTRRFGRNRNGSQRLQCISCARTFTDESTRPADRRNLPLDREVLCLRMLLEGMSIRSTERITGIHRDTIMHAMVDAGERCQSFLGRTIRGIPVRDIQADEIWAFVKLKEKARHLRDYPEEGCGDAYCYTALERRTKLLVTWHVGKRNEENTWQFARKLREATVGNFQLTTDGFHPYRTAIPATFGRSVDFAVLIKNYHESPEEGQRRYSPPEVIRIVIRIQTGNPEKALICTSHVERSNLSIRMSVRRLTRLTNAFSKKWENHSAALALFFGFYNYCRPHQTLTEQMEYRCTPAMKAGLADHVWTVEELLQQVA